MASLAVLFFSIVVELPNVEGGVVFMFEGVGCFIASVCRSFLIELCLGECWGL
jgi:hypothetical protein